MKDEEVIEIRVNEQLKRQVMNRIVRAHVAGLDIDKAQELGLYDRISILLTGMFTLQSVAYRLYGGVEYLLGVCGASEKHEIRVACHLYQQAFDNFLRFWSNLYMSKDGLTKEMNEETEALFHQFMRWAQLPESWSLGEPQRTDSDTETLMELDEGDGNMLLKFYRSVIESKIVDEGKESWMVSRYDRKTKRQFEVESGLGKADAQMIAKRLSDNDREQIYIVSLVREFTEKKAEASPVKAYKANRLISDVRKILKKD